MRIEPNPAFPTLPRGFSLPRSLAIAAAVILHLTLAAMLAMPIATPEPPMPEPVAVAVDVLPPPPAPPIAPAPAPPRPVVRTPTPVRAVPAPTPTPTAAAPEALAAPPTDAPSLLDTPARDTAGGPDGVDGAPAEATLQLRSGTPPRYPPSALARRLEGEVELLILVGIDGRPQTVTVARSSGHIALDRAARDHVLRRWIFEPTLRNGVAVPAYARVPVRFTLP